ncbi:MAG: GHKL domain-containing protein [Armatimonadetes bacterium]|nr:GHKL domain-containing protein [Armatimonadota bacterium]
MLGPTDLIARLGPHEVARERERLLAEQAAMVALEAIPDPAMVLNVQRQILAVNQALLSSFRVEDLMALLGMRPGEAVGCRHADEGPGGCGTSPACTVCGALRAMLECLQSGRPACQEARLSTSGGADGGALDLRVYATPLRLHNLEVVLVTLRDISDELRRRVLERLFFHDVMNTAGGLHGVAGNLLREQDPLALRSGHQTVYRLSERMIEEIAAQRQLASAEHGELEPQPEAVFVPVFLHELRGLYRHHEVAVGRQLQMGRSCLRELWTDPLLLRRVLGNLLKNALEATGEGGVVTVSAEDGHHEVVFRVHNAGAMPLEVQQQIFQRSFSTKEGAGRGLGSYSVRLFTERYLGGQVSFSSTPAEGTTFSVAIPIRPRDGC